MKYLFSIGEWLTGRLTYLLLAALACSVALQLIQSFEIKHLEKKLEAQLVLTGGQAEKLTTQKATLEDLASKRDQLVANLATAEAKANEMRKAYKVKVQKVLAEPWPADCKASAVKARDIVQEAINGSNQ